MPRISRLTNNEQTTVYHVMSRTALGDFPLGDTEKDFLLNLIKRFAGLYLVEMLGFCLMGNHFHLLVRVFPEHHFSDEEIKQRYTQFYGETRELSEEQIPALPCVSSCRAFQNLYVKLRLVLPAIIISVIIAEAIFGGTVLKA